MSEKRDWDRVRREDRVRLRGSLPYWQDGWAAEVEFDDLSQSKNNDNPVQILTLEFKGSLTSQVFWQDYRCYRQEYHCVGLSKIIRDWVLHPLQLNLHRQNEKDYQEALGRSIRAIVERLEEKTLLDDIVFGNDAVIKVIYKSKKLIEMEDWES